MADVEALRHIVAEIIPFNRILAISIASAATDCVELVQPEAPERMNYVGTAHTTASVLFMLGEAAAEAIVLHAFHDLIRTEGFVPFVLETTIIYHRPARGTLHSISTLLQEEQTRIRDELGRTGRTRFTISTRILEESGTLVAELEAIWGLRKPRRET
jgi:acyl-CoA thioesterase FadM